MNKTVTEIDTRGAAAIFERYRRDDAPKPVQWNETLDLILAHRSHRNFLPEKLPEGALETIIAAAQSASTSSNLQVWSVVAVEDQDRKNCLADLAGGQQHIRDCAVFLIWLADLARLEQLGQEKGRDCAALPYLELFLTGAVDAALAAQNAVTALESLGLGCCYIGAMRNKPEEVAKELNLPAQGLRGFWHGGRAARSGRERCGQAAPWTGGCAASRAICLERRAS